MLGQRSGQRSPPSEVALSPQPQTRAVVHTPMVTASVYVCSVASVVSNSLRPCGLQPARLLCPWDSPGKNTGVGCCALLQGIFLTQGSILHLVHLLNWRVGSLPRVPPGRPHQCAGEGSKGLQLEGGIFLSPSPRGRGRGHGEVGAGSLCGRNGKPGPGPSPSFQELLGPLDSWLCSSITRTSASVITLCSESSHGGLPHVYLCPSSDKDASLTRFSPPR